jgi:hypothetical protein
VFILVDNADMQQDRDTAKHILNNMELADRIGCSNFTQSQSIGGSHHDAASSAGQNMLAGMTISQRLQRTLELFCLHICERRWIGVLFYMWYTQAGTAPTSPTATGSPSRNWATLQSDGCSASL